MEIIPAIDLLGGRAVRLRKGRYDEVTEYDTPPEEIARGWREHVRRLHLVDLEGAREGRPIQGDLVTRVVRAFGAGVQVGGGVRSLDALRAYMDLGVDRVVLGTAAIRNPELLQRATEEFPDRVIVALDAKAGRVATDGWLDVSDKLAVDLAREFARLRIAAVLYTDIERDGTEVGPNIAETERLAREASVAVIASGGVGTLSHLEALARTGCIGAAIVGRALHEQRFSLAEAVRAVAGVGSGR